MRLIRTYFVVFLLGVAGIANAQTATPTPTPTLTPTPVIDTYTLISGTSGDITARFDMIVTAGDVAIVSTLLFIAFTLWVVIILMIVSKRDDWK